MLVDGGATSVIVRDSSKLLRLRPANIPIEVGGGGHLYYATKAGGKMVVNHAIALYMPNFGFDVIPETSTWPLDST